ncbi:MAG: LamG domain-containing protein, partial [Salibacteraceae bacterium]|nr:LamG domain-containing protein [Salibacteraceae bacterium]
MKPNYAVLLLSFLLSSLLHAQNIPSYLPSSGLVAWYPFSGNVIDSSGNGNNGTLNGSVSLTNDRFGNANSCYSFPGTSNSYIDCGNSSSLQIIEAISISGWFYMDGGNYNPRIISFEGSGGFGVFMDGTLNTSRIIHATNYNADGTGTGFCCSSSQGFSVAALQWHHFIYTADSTGLAKMYIDGDLVGTYQGTPVTNISFAGAVLNIGRLSKPAYDAWGGKLDDIGIWNRALSSSEIQTIYSACTLTYSVPQDTLIACGVDSTQIDAGSGFSTYAWSNGANTQSTYVSTSGMYHITVTNSNGCEAEDSVYVSLINAQIEQNDTTICAFESINLGLATFDNSTSPDLMQSDLQNGLLAWYPFNGNSNDESGNGNHGTATGALLTTNRTGDAATAYNFDGNDRIDFPGTILSTTDTEVSISLWFKLDTLIPVVYTVLRYRFNGHNYAITKFSSNTIQMLIWDGSSWTIIYEELANTNWNHCVITNSSSANESNVYLNGILVGTEAYVNNGDIENVGFTAGVYPTGTSYTYGIIDDIAIYNRALSLNEARLLSWYNSYSWSTGDTTATINVTPTQ